MARSRLANITIAVRSWKVAARALTTSTSCPGTPELDDHEGLGTWARKCWQALQALQDFVEHSKAGTFSGSVDTYLNSTPTGAHGYSPC